MNALATKRIDNQIKALVSSAVFDVFNDPDYGLNLSAKAKKRLSTPSNKKNKTLSLNQIKRKYL
ncbi:hypothetical protein A2914_01440 [Candidatus Nomurabacteria bacterium RIFCSPLOWO2_01_FULL_41_21]|uniref:Uncharacterized protein n=2 Tax=Candidatus Nomuraibacteriota TaxID=1752729 RepID=A0A1F6X1G9_9BACT|nr:MAG: hypothetical protein A2647_03990 [Candidatus Nomurabacteria bacterium RIFCSPHIGHO2_01_FULL_40_24b]OGI87970.1 MAG: hypothetical protein A2914_01440 [Candidatus Nomurabacteria bacterium RIFCSPLOWO2_01_FULL_41_21]